MTVKKEIKKIVSMLAAVMMLTGMLATTAFAATPTNGVAVTDGSDNTLVIAKHLDGINADLTSIDGPGITFTFTVAPATVAAGTTITDGSGNVGNVHAGVAGGLSFAQAADGQVSYPKGTQINASSSGADNGATGHNITLTATPSAFSAPGIYRYILTDTTTDTALENASIIRNADYDPIRYVDVYIGRNTDSTFKVEGFVIGSDKDGDGNLEKADFETSQDDSGASLAPVDTTDSYKSYNIILEKDVTGNMGDRQNQFPFAVTLTNNGRTYYALKGSEPTAVAANLKAANALTPSTTLAHGEAYYISDLDPQATVAYTETNNTPDGYKVTVTGSDDAVLSAQSVVAASGTKVLSAQAVTDYDATSVMNTAATATNANDITFENNFESVSPTGIIMRFGLPIALLMLGAAVVALRKKEELD